MIVPYLDTQLILTSDRDEKIRVSYYPDSYDILSYCLGHKTFVSTLAILPSNKHTIAFSGGGDNEIYLWDFVSGKLLQQFSLSPHTKEKDIIREIVVINETQIAVLVEE